MTVLTVEYPGIELRCYNKAGVVWDGFWEEEAGHSQGVLKAPRNELIHHEEGRIRDYRRRDKIAPGYDPLLPERKIIEYFAWRNSRAKNDA